jgi:pyruvyl transferase EpsO
LLRGRAVVSDRLHAHVLSVLLGLPHVLLDNNYGKVRAVYDTWTSACELAHWVDSPEEALAIARGL